MTDITSAEGMEGWVKRADRTLRGLEQRIMKARIPRVCTSTTRPDVTKFQPGVRLFETDTNRSIVVNGTRDAWVYADSGTGGGGSYTDEQAQDAAALLFTNGTHTGISYTYDDTGNRINSTVTVTGSGGGAAPSGATIVLPSNGDLVAAAAALGAGQILDLTAGALYTVSQTVVLSANSATIRGNGASVRLASGAQTDDDRLFNLTGTGCTLESVRIIDRAAGSNSVAGGWIVQISGTRNTVRRCAVSTTIPSNLNGGQNSIGVASGADHTIESNVVTGGGTVLYAWTTSARCRCVGNLVVGSVGNGLSGVGNSGTPSMDNQISGNVVVSAGRFGIEDFGYIIRSVVANNTIISCAAMGMSLVSGRYLAVGNRIFNSGSEQGIEAACSGSRLVGNDIIFEDSNSNNGGGIIVNGSSFQDNTAKYKGISIESNDITNANQGIIIQGDNADVSITGGTLKDCGGRALNLEGSSAHLLRVSDVTVIYTKPYNGGVRDAVSIANMLGVQISGCRFVFRASSSGGTAPDYFVRCNVDQVILTNNVFDGGGRTDANKPVVGNGYGSSLAYCNISYNTLRGGATIQTNKFAATSQLTGNFSQP